jgi:hypothetical protein
MVTVPTDALGIKSSGHHFDIRLSTASSHQEFGRSAVQFVSLDVFLDFISFQSSHLSPLETKCALVKAHGPDLEDFCFPC